MNTITLPTRIKLHAPHLIVFTCANTMGNPSAEMTMPVVRKIANSEQALLVESKLLDVRRDITVGIGDKM